MKTVVAIILLLTSSRALCQNSKENEQVIYEFMREYFRNKKGIVLQHETYKCLSCSTQEEDLRVVEQLQMVVPEQEVKYLMQQYEQMVPSPWNADSLKNIKLIAHQTIKQVLGNRSDYKKWQHFKQQYGNSLYTINKPLLSQDRQTLLVYMERECGDDCGWTKLAVFKKDNGEWKEVAQLYSLVR